MIYVYILECADKSFYVGSTMSIKLRLQQHNSGKGAKYTSKRLPVKLVYLESVSRLDRGFEREHQIKRWSRRKKQALIDSDFKLLRELSKAGSTSSPAILPNEIPLNINALSNADSKKSSPAILPDENSK